MEEVPQFVIEDDEFVGQVFDLDVATGRCVFIPQDMLGEIRTVIKDPLIQQPGNPYVKAAASDELLHVRARAKVSANDPGEIAAMVIDGLVQPQPVRRDAP